MGIGRSINSEVAKLLQNHLDKFYQKTPINFLVAGVNNIDGIGDFIHIYDFFKYFKTKFANSAITLKGLCQIDEKKLEMIKRIYGKDFFKEIKSEENNEEKLFNDHDFIVHSYSRNSGNPLPGLLDPAVLLNVSLPKGAYIDQYFKNFKNVVYTNSILEYGKYKHYYDDEQTMGVLPDQLGIKFDPLLVKRNNLSESEKNALIDELSQNELKKVLKKDSADTGRPFICTGYIQSEFDSQDFVKLVIVLAGNRNICMISNLDCFLENGKLSSEFLDLLKVMNINQVELMDHQGNNQETIAFSKVTSPKVFKLVKFVGISNDDKKILFSAADCVAGSGDTSISEMIASRKFPFFALPPWKSRFLDQIIEDINNRFPKFNELISYFIMHKTGLFDTPQGEKIESLNEEKQGSLSPYFVKNQDIIRGQWQEYCSFLIAHRNVEQSLDRIADHAIISSLLKNGTQEEIDKLLVFHKEILLSAIKINDVELLKKILAILPTKIALDYVTLLKICIERHYASCAAVLINSKFFAAHAKTTADIMKNVVYDCYALYSTNYELSTRLRSLISSIAPDRKIHDNISEAYDCYFKKIPKKSFHQVQVFSYNDSEARKDLHALCKVAILVFIAIKANDSSILWQNPDWLLLQNTQNKQMKTTADEIEKMINEYFKEVKDRIVLSKK